ncbi:phage terminase small subunit P27 family [Nocardiopsis sp. CT-R113]|uniref:Phage terminase small subunit P27 family n=1 Tax=Nocardiopsis codii TaxID=3065942 RepID=A0ABU7KDT4_9ACTN|nr:phage terminase small subunit P27 family [Nocardiopsis sp. CT-R113]MEE2040192.1 phage terminase small subunit P27 family [Nocardiopsis sp. CT-R113]
MAKPGPRPKPTSLKLLDGTRPDRVNTDEPLPGQGTIAPPAWLVALHNQADPASPYETALDVWNRLAPDLEAKTVLTPWDVDTFAVWCDAVVRHREAVDELAQYGVMVIGQKGERVKNPAVQIARDYAETMTRIGARFGLTPSDRAGLKIDREEVRGGAERFLS